MAMIEIISTTVLADCTAFTLYGPNRIRADDIPAGEKVTIYEQRADGDFEPAKDQGVQIELTAVQPSRIVEGYGDYKALKSSAEIGGVGRAS